MPFRLANSSFPNVIPGGTGLSTEVLQFIDRIRRELPGENERSRLTIKTYMEIDSAAPRKLLLGAWGNTERVQPRAGEPAAVGAPHAAPGKSLQRTDRRK